MSRVLWPAPLSNAPNLVTLKFRFQVNGTSAPDALVPANCGVTDVTYDDTPKAFTITFDEKFPVFIGGFCSVMPGAPETAGNADFLLSMDVADYSSTNGTLVVYSVGVDGTTAAEVPPDDSWIYCELTFCRRSTQAPSGSI